MTSSSIHALRYDHLYAARPFTDAVILYQPTGRYRIWSKGERHDGLYIAKAAFGHARQQISFLSTPSSDWDGRVARHELVFEGVVGAFVQLLSLPGDVIPLPQFGRSAWSSYDAVVRAVESVDDWDSVRFAAEPLFDALPPINAL